jgi:hypothetical protein
VPVFVMGSLLVPLGVISVLALGGEIKQIELKK